MDVVSEDDGAGVFPNDRSRVDQSVCAYMHRRMHAPGSKLYAIKKEYV
eukprot:COSAG01_NODE_13326_length_1600_cov_5.213191_1_plen_47_part_10